MPSYLPGGNKSGGMHFGGEDFDPELWYWEANTAGKLRYPHSIQLVVGSFRELFGTELGRQQLQAWCKRWGWPLAWAPGAGDWRAPRPATPLRPGRLLDPFVLAASRAGGNITVPEKARAAFGAAWGQANATANATQTDKDVWWESLRSVMPPMLELEPLRGGSCQAPAAGRCVGTTQSGDCVCYG